MQRKSVYLKARGNPRIARPARKSSQPHRLATDPMIPDQLIAPVVAGHGRQWRAPDIFHDEPGRLGLRDTALKFRDKVLGFGQAVVADKSLKRRKCLTGRPANQTIKSASRWRKPPDISSPDQIRTAHDAKASLFERLVKQADTRKKRKHKSFHGCMIP
jgi:hypothetical protein